MLIFKKTKCASCAPLLKLMDINIKDWSSLKRTALHRLYCSEEGVHHGPMSAWGLNFILTLVYAKYR